MSEVLREREAQIEVKEAKERRSKEVDRRYQSVEDEVRDREAVEVEPCTLRH